MVGVLLQMGGPAGVRAQEQYALVIGLKDGMMMHAIPRPGVAVPSAPCVPATA